MTLAGSTWPEPAADLWPSDAVEVGVVVGAWGVRGGLRIKPHAADPQALFATKRWFLQLDPAKAPSPVSGSSGPSGAFPGPAAPPARMILRVASAREQGDTVVATAQDLLDRTRAEGLRGARVYVSRASFPTAGEGEFYWVDLLGLAVVNRQGVALGDVVGLLQTGPHSVLRLRSAATAAGTAERLIPFVDAYIDAVDLAARRITVDWGEDD